MPEMLWWAGCLYTLIFSTTTPGAQSLSRLCMEPFLCWLSWLVSMFRLVAVSEEWFEWGQYWSSRKDRTKGCLHRMGGWFGWWDATFVGVYMCRVFLIYGGRKKSYWQRKFHLPRAACELFCVVGQKLIHPQKAFIFTDSHWTGMRVPQAILHALYINSNLNYRNDSK